MKRMLLLCLALGIAPGFAAELPELPGTPVKVRWGAKQSVAACENGVYRAAGIKQGDGVEYISFRVPLTGDVKGKAIGFSARTTTPGKTPAFYLRGYDKQNKCVLSWKNWASVLGEKAQTFVLNAGVSVESFQWENNMIKAEGTELACLEFIIGSRSPADTLFGAEFSDIRICDAVKLPEKPAVTSSATATAKLPSAGFEDLGIPAKSAEQRSSIAWLDEKGTHYLLIRPQDHGPRGYLLLTNLDTGKTEQYYNPPNVRQGDNFGSILTSKGVFLYDQGGGHVLKFDLRTRKTEYLGRPDAGKVHHYMVYYEAPDGTVYLGGYPQASITSWDPKTGKFRCYGRMDPKEQYLNLIATDKNGYVYCGIGSARANLVALDPKSGKVTQIIPEEMRGLGYGRAYSGADGYAYLAFGKFTAKLLDGKVVATNADIPEQRNVLSAKYGGRLWKFPDGTRVRGVDLYTKIITFEDKDGKRRSIPFDFVSGGLHFTSMGQDGQGRIFASTSHPMHFTEFNAKENKLIDHGPHPIVSGGNFCNITYAPDGTVYMCEYAGGRMWRYLPQEGYRAGARNTPSLGLSPQDLNAIGKAEGGHFTMVGGSILLCFGDRDGAKFTFPLKVDKAGKQYLNILGYEHSIYGTMKFHLDGKEIGKANLQNIVDRPREMAFGPFELAEGTHEVAVTVHANKGDSRPMAGLLGMMFAENPVKATPPPKHANNPEILGAWHGLITRPRAIRVHPDGQHVVMAGYAGYGLCGGGFGIHDLKTGKNSRIENWLDGHSCIAFCFSPEGDILGGTDVAAPGGGYVRAKHPAIFRIDWKTGKVTASQTITDADRVSSVALWRGKFYAALSSGQVVVADPKTMKIERTHANDSLGACPRNNLQTTPDGRLFLLQNFGISEFHPVTGNKIPLARPGSGITVGGAVESGYLYYASGSRFIRWKIPAPLK